MGSDWWGTFCDSTRNQYIYPIYQRVKVLHCFAILIRKGVTSSSAFMMRRWGRDGAHASKCTGRVQEASRGAVCDLRMHIALQYFHCRCILHNAVGALVSFAPRHFTAGAVCTCWCTSSAATIPRILSKALDNTCSSNTTGAQKGQQFWKAVRSYLSLTHLCKIQILVS